MGSEQVVPSREGRRKRLCFLTPLCNNSCIFCPISEDARQRSLQREVPPNTLITVEEGADEELCLIGGEPTLLDDLPDLIGRASTLGFNGLLLQTNGRRLSYPRYLQALIDAGLTAVDISLHGPRREIHEYHTRTPGSFMQTVTALRAAAKTSLEVGVSTVVTRSNYRHLSEVVRLVSYAGADTLHLSIARPLGRALELYSSIIPRLTLAARHVHMAKEEAGKLGVFVFVSGLPLCLAGDTPPLPDQERGVFGAACEGCLARPSCMGLDEAHARFHGFSELRSRGGNERGGVLGEDLSIRSRRIAGCHLWAEGSLTLPDQGS